MADIQHSVITSSDCHEPKHISTSLTSQSGMVITPSSTVAGTSELRNLVFQELDEAGSVSVLNTYATYQDSTYTSSVPLAVTAGVRTKVTIDALGAQTDETNLPVGVSLWNSTTNKMTPTFTTDTYDVRLTFTANTAAGGDDVLVDLDIGVGTPILQEAKPLLKAPSNTPILCNWSMYVGTDFLANGGEFYVTPSANTTFWDFGIFIERKRKGGTS